jgi:hypothetical protein
LSAISVCGTLRVWNVERFCPDRVCGETWSGQNVSHGDVVFIVTGVE